MNDLDWARQYVEMGTPPVPTHKSLHGAFFAQTIESVPPWILRYLMGAPGIAPPYFRKRAFCTPVYSNPFHQVSKIPPCREARKLFISSKKLSSVGAYLGWR